MNEILSAKEALELWTNASWTELAEKANKMRIKIHGKEKVSYTVFRIINYTNICEISCSFCSFKSSAGTKPYTLSFEGISNQRTFEYGFSKGTVSEIASRQGYPAAAECVSAERYTYLPINNLYILSEFLGDFSFTLPKGVTFFDKNTGKDLTLEAGNQALDARRMCGIISALSKVEELDLRDYLMGKIQDDSENQKIIADMITAAAKAKLKSGTDIEKIFDKFTSLAETDISVYDFELRHSGFEKLINSGKLKFTVKEVAK